MDSDDDVGNAERLRAAREAAFKRGATPDDTEALRRMEAGLAIRSGSPEAAPQDSASPARQRHRSAARMGAAGLVLGLVLGSLGGWAIGVARGAGIDREPSRSPSGCSEPKATSQQVQDRVALSSGTFAAEDYYRLYPEDLPLEWREARAVTSSRGLTSPTEVAVPAAAAATFALVIPTCPVVDRRFSWTLVDRGAPIGTGHGTCGRFDQAQVALPVSRHRTLSLRIRVDGPAEFAVSVLQR